MRTGEPALRQEWWQSYLVPTHGHRLTILNQSALAFVPFNDRLELWHDMDAHGWRRREIPTPEDHRKFLARIKQEFGRRMAAYQVGEPPVKALREGVERADAALKAGHARAVLESLRSSVG